MVQHNYHTYQNYQNTRKASFKKNKNIAITSVNFPCVNLLISLESENLNLLCNQNYWIKKVTQIFPLIEPFIQLLNNLQICHFNTKK